MTTNPTPTDRHRFRNTVAVLPLDHGSHLWFYDEDGTRCGNCDCRFGGRWSPLPCGTGEENYDEVAEVTIKAYLATVTEAEISDESTQANAVITRYVDALEVS